MLSRLVSSRSSSLIKHVVKPCVVASTHASTRDISTREPYVNSWRAQAWPVLAEYKGIAGKSSSTVLGIGTLSYILSKEIFVLNEEVFIGAFMAFALYNISKAAGPLIGENLRAMQKAEFETLNEAKTAKLTGLTDQIASTKSDFDIIEARDQFYDIAKNREGMKQDLVYRQRLHEVNTEVKKRLDYQVDLQTLEKDIEEKHIASWVEAEVLKSIADQSEEETLLQCIKDLNSIADDRAALA